MVSGKAFIFRIIVPLLVFNYPPMRYVLSTRSNQAHVLEHDRVQYASLLQHPDHSAEGDDEQYCRNRLIKPAECVNIMSFPLNFATHSSALLSIIRPTTLNSGSASP